MSDNSIEKLMHMIVGSHTTQMLYVAAKLDLAEHLAGGQRSVAELAKLTGTHERTLYRLLRGLASIGVFSEQEDGRFATNAMAEGLRDGVPGSQRAMAIMHGEEHYQCWGRLLDAVKTGEVQFEKVYGQPCFDYIAGNPEVAKNFDKAMVGAHGREAAAMVDAYDFSKSKYVIDIGGGNGSLLVEILRANPNLRGAIFDLQHVVQRAGENLKAAGMAERCQTLAGNFFESIPGGADTYLMRHILHDWNDQKCLSILRNIHKVIPADGRLLIVESVIEAGNAPAFGKILDLTMLLLPGGMERTRVEFTKLLGEAGFTIKDIVPTRAEVSVIEARKA